MKDEKLFEVVGEPFLNNITQNTNERLCDIIVSSRYLGSMKELAICCMQELAGRRTNGDVFDFETYIDEKIKTLPDFKIDVKQKMNLGIDISFLGLIK